MSKYAFRIFTRILALVMAMILMFSMSAGTLGVLAEGSGASLSDVSDGDSGGDSSSGDGIDDTHTEPDASDSREGGGLSDDGDESGTVGVLPDGDADSNADEPETPLSEGSETHGDERPSVEEQSDTEMKELSGYFSEFVTSAILIGTDGDELPESSNLELTDTVRLSLTADFSAPVSAAIREGGDREYSVHIPDKLAAEDGTYEIKASGKPLGKLYIDAKGAYFVFNTGGDPLFDEDGPDGLKGVRLDIPCRIDKNAIGGETEFVIDLSEYAAGKTYIVRLAKSAGIAPMILPVNPAGDFSQFVAGIKLTGSSGSKAAEISSPYLMNSSGSVYLRFELENLDASDLLAIKQNGGFKYKVEIPGMLAGTAGTHDFKVAGAADPLGTLTIETDGSAYFVFNTSNGELFNDDIAMLENLWMDIICTLDLNKLNVNDRSVDINMTPYDGSKTYSIVLSDRVPAEPQMYKSGSCNENTGLYDWTVTVIAPESGDPQDWIKDIVFTDTTGPNHKLWGKITVAGTIKDSADPNVNTQDTSALDPTKIIAGGFTLELAGPYTGTLTLAYSTTLTKDVIMSANPGTVDLSNNAQFTYGGGSKTLSGSYELSKVNNAFVQKDGVFIPGDQSIEWTVTVDTFGQGYSYMNLYDRMSQGIKHKRGSITVNGTPVTLPDEYFYPDTTVASSEIMKLPLFKNSSALYTGNIITVKYRTPIDNMEYYGDQSPTITNDAWLDFGWLGGSGMGDGSDPVEYKTPTVGKGTQAISAPVLKEAVSYDTQNKVITWKITVNSNRLNLTNVVVTDEVLQSPNTHGNLTYVAGSLTIGGDKYTGGFSPATNDTTGTFNLPDLNGEEAAFRVTTTVTDSTFLTGNGKGTFNNKMSMTATAIIDESGATRAVTGSHTASITPTNNVLEKKAGEYDYATNTLDWTIVVNADRITPFKGENNDGIFVMDTIPAGQKLVAGSIAVTGSVPASINTTIINGFGINLGDISGKMVTITYKTCYDPLPNDKTLLTFSNTAKLTSQYGTKEETVTETVSFTVLKKSTASVVRPDNSTALVAYQVLINQSAQPFSQTVNLTDMIAAPQGAAVDVDLDSVMLYNAVIDDKGGFTKGGEVVGFSKNFADSKLTAAVPAGTGACVLEYEVVVRSKPGETLGGSMGNSIKFDNFSVNGNSGYSSNNTASLDSDNDSGGNFSKYIKVQITKEDEKTGAFTKLLPGATFGLYLNKTGNAGNYTLTAQSVTDSKGIVTFNLLMPSDVDTNHYYIKEISYPQGYDGLIGAIVNTDGYIKVKSGTLNGNIYEHTITNKRKEYTVSFAKVRYDNEAKQYVPLPGAAFWLTADKEDPAFTPIDLTSTDGIFTISGLKWGKYTLKEKTFPAGYVPHDCSYTLEVSDTGAVKITVDDDGKTSPATAVIGSFDAGGSYGVIPAIVNEKGSVTITKRDSETNAVISKTDALSGAEFNLTIKGDSDTVIKTGETGADGKLTFYDLEYGETYVITETDAPTGYELASPAWNKEFTIGPDTTIPDKLHYSEDVTNKRKGMYGFSFLKHVKNYLDTGTESVAAGADSAIFQLFRKNADGTKGDLILDDVKPDTSGKVTFRSVAFGDYYIVEIKAPDNYALPRQELAMEVNLSRSPEGAPMVKIYDLTNNRAEINATDKPFVNEKGSFTITKKDNLYTGTPAANLAGAQFEVSPSRTGVTLTGSKDVVTTGTDGKVFIDGLDVGTAYTFTEITAPTGYTKNSTPLSFTPSSTGKKGEATVDGNGDFENNRNPVHSFSFIKTDEYGIGLSGAVFGIALASNTTGSQTFNHADVTSSSDGTVAFSALPYGSYIVVEKDAPEGFRQNTVQIEFTIEPDGTVSNVSGLSGTAPYTFTNYLGSFTVTKKDAVDGSAISGVEFDLYKYENGNYTKINLPFSTTGQDGKLKIDGLYLTTQYQLRERGAPVGYKPPVSADYIIFTLTDDDTTDAQTGYNQWGDYKNYRDPIYSFGFIKRDDHGNALGGAVFGLFSDPSCTNAVAGFDTNGSPVAVGHSKIATSASGTGNVVFNDLAFGTYYVKELSAPADGANSYNKSEAVLKVEIASGGSYEISDNTNTASAATSAISGFVVENELLGSITVIKQDKFNQKLQGVEFTLWDENKSNQIGTAVTTDTNGVASFTGLTLGQTYAISEGNPLPGYLPHSDIKVKLEYAADPTKYRVTLTVTNDRESPYSIDFIKQDAFGNALSGAEFGIIQVADNAGLSVAGTGFAPNSRSVSGADGIVEFTDLSFGRYFIRETAPPTGYTLSDTILQADIGLYGSVVVTKASGADVAFSGGKAVMINNHSEQYSITFDKLALNTGNGLAGAVFSVTPIADTDGNVVILPVGTATTATSDGHGKVIFSGLPFGAYLVKEVSAPASYVKCEGSFNAEISIGGSVLFSQPGDIDPLIDIASDGKTASVKNSYTPPTSGSGSSSGGSSSGGSSKDSHNNWNATPQINTNPSSLGDSLPPFFPQDSTVTRPVVVQKTDDYKITTQTISTPNGESYDSVIITVTNPGGAVIGELTPPPPRDGYEFEGWYLDPEMKIPYKPGDRLPKGEVRLYAKWYLGASQLDDNNYNSYNPKTGDNSAHKPVAGMAMLALIAVIMASVPFKNQDKTSVTSRFLI